MKVYTIEEVMGFKPCYSREKIESIANGRESMTVLEVLDLDIPIEDRIWLALQSGDHVEPAIERIVARAVRNHVLTCGIPKVEQWATNWLDGTDKTQKAAESAAWSAREATWSDREAAWVRSAWVRSAWAAKSAMAAEPAWVRSAREAVRSVREAREAELELQITDIRSAVLDCSDG